MNSFQKIMIAAGLLMTALQQAHADTVVIVSAQSTAPTLSREQIARIFQGKSYVMTPVDLARPSAVRREFYTKFVGADEASVRARWSKLLFTGKRSLPKEFASSEDLVTAVAADPNTIGYVDRSFVNMTVKVIYTVK